jgi:hypothetical protein
MPVNNKNLYFTLGDSYTFNCLAQDYQQNVLNITSATLACTASREPTDATAFTGTCTLVSGPSGTFTVNFPSSVTAALPDFSQVLFYTVTVNIGGTATYTIQSGNIYLSPA